MLRRHRPRRAVVAGRIGAIALQRIAVDQGAHEHRIGDAAYLVLDREQMPPALDVDDVAESVLILVVLAVDELAEPAVWTGEVDDVDLHVMLIVFRKRPVGLAEDEILVLADLDPSGGAVGIGDGRGRTDHRRVESRDAARGADRHVELDIGHAERDASEARKVGLVAANPVAPWAGRLDVVVMLREGEPGALELLAHRGKPIEQRRAAGDDEAGMAAQDLRLVGRQMELAAPDIDPHVVVRGHQVGVARKAEPRDIEQRGEALVRDGDVHVLEVDGVAEIFSGAIESLLHDWRVPKAIWRWDDITSDEGPLRVLEGPAMLAAGRIAVAQRGADGSAADVWEQFPRLPARAYAGL